MWILMFVIVIVVLAMLAPDNPSDNDWGGQALHGTHRVLYPEGYVSQRMNLSNARKYAAIFGGIVIAAQPQRGE